MLLLADANVGGDDTKFIFLFASVVYIALFAWLAIAAWAKQRRREREAYYQHEVEKRIVETGGATSDQLRELREDEHRRRWEQRREGLKLAGLITTALGLGIFLGLRFVTDDSVYQVGWIPLTIGGVLLGYVYLLYPRRPSKGLDS